MRLIEFRVRTFRNVVDSGPVTVEDDITCLVGKNESGKTALLHALLRAKPSMDQPLEPSEHYPRWLLARDRKDGTVEDAAPIEVTFALDAGDREAVEALAGPGVLRSPTFRFGLRYDGSFAAVDLDAGRAVNNVLDRVGVSETTRAALADADTVEGLRELAAAHRDEPAATADAPAGSEAVASTRAARAEFDAVATEVASMLSSTESLWQAVVAVLDERMPTFVYFDDYALLPGRIDLEVLADPRTPESLQLDTARALLQLAGTDAEALLGDAYELQRAELEAASNDLTGQVFDYWSQDHELSIEIDLDTTPVPHGAARTVLSRNLDIRVRDRRRGFTTNFSQRSTGFQWFFSFLAVASSFERFPHGVVVLLDEPALTLHPAGQADLLRFIEQRVAPRAQVIYTTHSPFMINPDHPDRVRMVEDRGPQQGALVLSDPAEARKETLAPLRTVLGLALARRLFENEPSLVVGQPADVTYLMVLSEHLAQRGRAHLSSRWRVLPAGGAAGIPVMLALLGRSPGVTVLVDGPADTVHHEPAAREVDALADHRLVFLSDVAATTSASVEDLFTDADYLRVHNGVTGARLRPQDIAGDGPVLGRVAAASNGAAVDRERAAALLVHRRRRILRKLSSETLQGFETLFEKLNATLG